MNNLYKYYPALAKLYKEYAEKATALYDEFAEKIDAIIPPDDTAYVSNMFVKSDFIQVYPDKASSNAEYRFESDDSDFYELCVDGVKISECVRKKG